MDHLSPIRHMAGRGSPVELRRPHIRALRAAEGFPSLPRCPTTFRLSLYPTCHYHRVLALVLSARMDYFSRRGCRPAAPVLTLEFAMLGLMRSTPSGLKAVRLAL
jgi:hypothetical protein